MSAFLKRQPSGTEVKAIAACAATPHPTPKGMNAEARPYRNESPSEQSMSLCRRHQVARMGETHEPTGSQEASRAFQVKTNKEQLTAEHNYGIIVVEV